MEEGGINTNDEHGDIIGTGSTGVSSSHLRPTSASVETDPSSVTPIVGSSSSASSSISRSKALKWTVASLGDVRKSGPVMLKLMNYTLKDIYNTCNPSKRIWSSYNYTCYWLLHRFIFNISQNYSEVECYKHVADIVCACIFLAGKTDFLFIKVDTILSICKKASSSYMRENQKLFYGRSETQDPRLEFPTQADVFITEMDLLFILSFDLRSVGNPFRGLEKIETIMHQSTNHRDVFKISDKTYAEATHQLQSNLFLWSPAIVQYSDDVVACVAVILASSLRWKAPSHLKSSSTSEILKTQRQTSTPGDERVNTDTSQSKTSGSLKVSPVTPHSRPSSSSSSSSSSKEGSSLKRTPSADESSDRRKASIEAALENIDELRDYLYCVIKVLDECLPLEGHNIEYKLSKDKGFKRYGKLMKERCDRNFEVLDDDTGIEAVVYGAESIRRRPTPSSSSSPSRRHKFVRQLQDVSNKLQKQAESYNKIVKGIFAEIVYVCSIYNDYIPSSNPTNHNNPLHVKKSKSTDNREQTVEVAVNEDFKRSYSNDSIRVYNGMSMEDGEIQDHDYGTDYDLSSRGKIEGYKIYIQGDYEYMEADTLRKYFMNIGDVLESKLFSRFDEAWFGFVTFRDIKAFEEALEKQYHKIGDSIDCVVRVAHGYKSNRVTNYSHAAATFDQLRPRTSSFHNEDHDYSRKDHGAKIFVRNLWNIREDDLKRYFESFGRVLDHNIPPKKAFGFVTFENRHCFDEVLRCRHEINGREIYVEEYEGIVSSDRESNVAKYNRGPNNDGNIWNKVEKRISVRQSDTRTGRVDIREYERSEYRKPSLSSDDINRRADTSYGYRSVSVSEDNWEVGHNRSRSFEPFLTHRSSQYVNKNGDVNDEKSRERKKNYDRNAGGDNINDASLPPNFKSDGWICPSCGFHVFSRNSPCACGTNRGFDRIRDKNKDLNRDRDRNRGRNNNDDGYRHGVREKLWTCFFCSHMNPAYYDRFCYKCHEDKARTDKALTCRNGDYNDFKKRKNDDFTDENKTGLVYRQNNRNDQEDIRYEDPLEENERKRSRKSENKEFCHENNYMNDSQGARSSSSCDSYEDNSFHQDEEYQSNTSSKQTNKGYRVFHSVLRQVIDQEENGTRKL